MQTHSIEIAAKGRGRYIVRHAGRVLIASTSDPEHDACRLLLAMGCMGTLQTRWRGSEVVALRLDIVTGAGLMVRAGRFKRLQRPPIAEGGKFGATASRALVAA